MVICLEQGADLHMSQWMPLPLTVSCFSKVQIGFTFLAPAHPGSPGQTAIKRVCVHHNVTGLRLQPRPTTYDLAVPSGWLFKCNTGTPAYGSLCANMMSSIKLEAHNVSQCCQRSTEPQPQITYTKHLLTIWHVVPEICSWTDGQRDRWGHHNTSPPPPV